MEPKRRSLGANKRKRRVMMKWRNRKPDSWLQRRRRFRRLFAKIMQEVADKRVPAVAVAKPPTRAFDSREGR